jgi:hypothetical protein
MEGQKKQEQRRKQPRERERDEEIEWFQNLSDELVPTRNEYIIRLFFNDVGEQFLHCKSK